MPDSDEVSDAAPVDSTPQVDAQQSDSSQQSAPSTTDSAAQPQAVTTDAQNGAADTQTQTSTPTQAKPATPPAGHIPEADFRNLQRELSRRSNELRQYQEKLKPYDGIDPRVIQSWREEKERAAQAKLPRWNPKHPENHGFSELKARWHQATQTYQRLSAQEQDPQRKEALKNHVLADFSPEEQAEMRNWSQHTRGFQERMAADPEGTLAEMIETRFANMIEQREARARQVQQAEQSVNGWFDTPQGKAVQQSQGEWMAYALESPENGGLGMPWAVVQREAEIRYLRSQMNAGQAKVQAAEERSRLAKGNASITRDPATTPVTDPYEHAKRLAKERGVEVGGPGWMEIANEASRLAGAH
jgi:hypothetical protein